MGSYGTTTNPAHFVEIADPANPGQVKRPAAGQVLKARTYPAGVALSNITTTDYGYWSATFATDAIMVSGDGGTTWVGPLFSAENSAAASSAGTDAATALSQSTTALSTAQQALLTAQSGPAATWDNISGKPATFPPTAHSHTSTQVSDSTTVGRAVLTAADAQAARTAIGAGTGNGTSNLTLGTTSTTAAPGNHTHSALGVTFTPTGTLTATDVQSAIVQAAASGGSSGTSSVLVWRYSSGAYPALPATKPAGVEVVAAKGPVAPSTVPSWVGTGPGQALGEYTYAALT